MSNKKKYKNIDIILLILFPIIATIISFAIKANFLTSTLLFFGLPSILLSYRNRRAIKKSLTFSAIFCIPLCISVDYIAVLDKAWFVPSSVFPFRLLGILPIEDFIWGFLLIYTVIMFYETFFDKTGKEIIDKKMKYLGLILGIILLLFFIALFTNPALLYIKYAYFWIGLILVLAPAVIFLSFFPKNFSKFVKTGIYFFFLNSLLELTGIGLEQWTFPGDHFVGWIELFGKRFPFEEFFFFITITAVAILSYYEFFDDDRK